MKKYINGILKILVYLTFLVPLIVLPASFIFPFIVPKVLVFRSLVVLGCGLYFLLLMINWEEYKPKISSISLALLLFLFSFTLSTFFGVDFYHSFWDNHERMLGLFTIFHYVIYYFICTVVFRCWEEWKKAFKIFLLAGSLVILLGLVQVVDPNFLLNNGNVRVSGTLGNAIYFSGYGLFLFFASILLFLKEKRKIWKKIEIIIGILAVLGIFFGGSRGAMVGFLLGVLILVIFYFYKFRHLAKVRNTALIFFLTLFLSTTFLFWQRDSDFIKRLPGIGRLFSTSISELTSGPRILAWKISIKAWKDKPILGWGPNNYFYAFNSNYNPQSLNFGYGETWFDNAHNIILNTLATQGIIGVLSYLSIFIFSAASLALAYRKQELDIHILVVGVAFLVAHLFQNITVFENPTSYLYFIFWLAMTNSLSLSEKEDVHKVLDKKISPMVVGIILTLATLLIFIFNIQPARANTKTFKVLKLLNSNPVLAAESIRQLFLFKTPHIDDIRNDVARSSLQFLSAYYKDFGTERTKELFDLAYGAVKDNLNLHPLDIRNHLMLSQLDQFAFLLTSDSKYLLESEYILNNALKLSPKRQQLLYSLANIKMQMGKSDEAEKILEGSIEDNKEVGEGYWRLGYIYYLSGKKEEAKAVIALAEDNGIVFDEQGKKILEIINDGK